MIVGIDTALVNTGFVVLNEIGEVISSAKPFSKKHFKGDLDSLFNTHRRIHEVAGWIWKRVYQLDKPFVALEDYLLTGRQRSYKTAELVAILKEKFWEHHIPYCLVHPLKTKKYVVKKRKVSKTEIIKYVMEYASDVFSCIDRADYSDIADAWVIAMIGKLIVDAMKMGKGDLEGAKVAILCHPGLEERWKEILLGDTGIMGKPGLLQWSY